MSKVIVITGASSGIGEATAKILAKDGHKIVLAARREERLKNIVEEIKKDGGDAIYTITDVSKLEENKELAKKAIEAYGRIDVWINNAGLMPLSEFSKGLVSEWDKMIDVNLKGTLYGIDAALPNMREKKSGQIINVASIAAHVVGSGTGVYSATKFGVLAASEALRQEEALAKSNIRVTVISPGAIDTELPNHASDKDVQENLKGFYNTFAISADQVAKTIKFTIDIEENTTINEIILRPTSQSY